MLIKFRIPYLSYFPCQISDAELNIDMLSPKSIKKSLQTLDRNATQEEARLRQIDTPVVVRKSVSDISREVIMAGSRFGYFPVKRTISSMRSIKTKDESRVRLAIAQHLYGLYSVPKHFQDEVWDIREVPAATYQYRRRPVVAPSTRLTNIELAGAQAWYKCVASGGSLYKEYTKNFLTKKMTHAFLNPPISMTFREAMVYAVASSFTSDFGIQTRLMKSKINTKPLFVFAEMGTAAPQGNVNTIHFWQEIIRFFCEHPVPINKLNDFVDFISAQEAGWSIKGRTIESLENQMEQWHRHLSRQKVLGNRVWDGLPLHDSVYGAEHDAKGNVVDWKFFQIKNSKDLALEGSKLHHCVYSYQAQCISGHTSIWSLSMKRGVAGDFEKQITIEVRDTTIVQVRGYANRVANSAEKAIIHKWARDSGLIESRFR
jgi:hypothetical protein